MASESGVSAWSCKQVAQWLQAEGFADYVDLLCADHRLDGPSLLALTEADLRGPPLSLTVLGDIKRLAISLRQLQRQNQAQVQELGLQPSDSLPAADWTWDRGDRHCNGGEFTGNGIALRQRNGTQAEYGSGAPLRHTHSNGRCRQHLAGRLDPEVWKTILSVIYVFLVFGFTSFVMVIVHERVPDMRTYPPLPDIFLDSVPRIPWAFAMAEACGLILCYMLMLILLLHKHRSILIRRLCSLMGTVFLLRCCTMFVTSLSVPGHHLKCASKVRSFHTYGNLLEKIQRALTIWVGFGMTLTGVQTCGDYMFSGHTVVITLLNFFVTEYTPRTWNLIHTISWVLNLFGIFFILAAHEHYSIDVFIAFYITTRLFLYYHTLANTRAYQQSRRARIWFPMFSFFECNVNGPVPNQYHWPFSKPAFMKTLIG
ncbi:sphingomyelin synthase-related protein 1-like isoform X1 [Hippocampus comes]|uniref:sphingomyelin synthase-related protein 1-like isoform X1 n=1 Tax=Hippocampus comes TaxID=109280 RepID=UPI00094E6ACE|nr:PREDICTED: sphingomyelin synthase-related protein 1-like isoform X1 [Hippocampus comes]XP_019726239.1 PREDICTED: sphingomyelin synthase-related protein 1-like isoform X1 [Hippocampus comes]